MTLYITIVIGIVAGLGLFLTVRELIPGQPHLQSALSRLSGADQRAWQVLEPDASMTQKVGAWVQRKAPALALRGLTPSPADLDLIAKSLTTHMGEKALCSFVGLVMGPALVLTLSLVGLSLPITVPVGASLLLALGCWFLPDLDARSKAKAARQEFAAAVSVYLELLAIERISGAGATQATEGAARVAKSWPFQRISTALANARWSGKTAWVALDELADEVEVVELHDVADIMRLAGKEGAGVYDQLRARAKSMRKSQLAVEQQLANENSTRMTLPGTMTALLFLVMLIVPIGIRTLSIQ